MKTLRPLFPVLFLPLFLMPRPAGAQTTEEDTIYVVHLDNHDVAAERRWANDTVRYRYNQMKYYVKTILPYLNAATALFNDIHTKLEVEGLSGKARRQYISEKEAELRTRFEDQVRQLNETQGVLLIKLIARQTGLNVYQSLQEFKGPVATIKWQTWARLHGLNLNRKYRPAEEPDLEHIMRSLGYPLPPFYGGSGDGY